MRALFLLSALCLVAPATAQYVTVETGVATSGLARCMNNGNNSIALTPDGAMWCVIYSVAKDGTNGHLELRRSTDHGKTWSQKFDLPNNTSHNNHHNNSGCIAPGRIGNELHVTWADKTAATSYWSAMHQVFDTQTLKWVGKPTLVAKGYSSNNQFWPVDIGVTETNVVAICVSGHRSGGLGLSSWDCGLALQYPGGSFNATLLNVRSGTSPYSQNACIAVQGETVHCCMKNNTGGYGINYRSYDTGKKAWNQTTDVPVGPNSNSGIAAGNKSVIATDTNGGVYVLYVTGNSTAARTLRLAYAAPGKGGQNSDWTDIQVISNTSTVGTNYRSSSTTAGDYPLIQGGNTTYRNYSLSPHPGGAMTVVYSKAFETFANLYVRQYKAGTATLPELKLSGTGTKPYSFEWITGLRNGESGYNTAWLSYGKTDAASPNNGTYPNGRVDFWRLGTSEARTMSFGTGCAGTQSSAPRMQARDVLPQINSAFQVDLDRFPASAGFYLMVGTKMTLPPLDLGFMGAASGCTIDIDFPILIGAAVNSSGSLQIKWNVPNDTKLVGTLMYTQCFVFAPKEAGGLLMSNPLAVVIGS